MREHKRFVQHMQADLMAMLVTSFFIFVSIIMEML